MPVALVSAPQDNRRRSPVFLAMEREPRFRQLLDKLHHATGLEKLAPEHPMLDRLVAAKDVDTMARIEEASA